MRINKYLARSGVAARRKAEEHILAGKVSVNGTVVRDLATDIDPEHDIVKIGGKGITLPNHVYYVLNKPTGYTTTRSDPHAKKTVFELLPEDSSLITVGRLDRETSGLLIITNDGEFAQNLIHPSKKIEKVYAATLKSNISDADIEKFTSGIRLSDGMAKFTKINLLTPRSVIVSIEEGRNRIVRRMFEGLGNEVQSLKRIRIGAIKLDVDEGKYRKMTEREVKKYA